MEKELIYEFDGETYCYKPSKEDMLYAISSIVFDNYFIGNRGVYDGCSNAGGIQKGIIAFINEYDLKDKLFEDWEEEVVELLRKQAREEWEY